jgi:hypothetical protein
VLCIFIALKKSITSDGFEAANPGPNGKRANHYTIEVTSHQPIMHVCFMAALSKKTHVVSDKALMVTAQCKIQ